MATRATPQGAGAVGFVIHLPVLEHIRVVGYGMYPGNLAQPGLDADLAPGATVILGANGLGKTTLITLIYRILAGPSDIPNLDTGEELGFRSLEAKALSRPERRTFAARVNDGAAKATCEGRFRIGDNRFVITRNLADLSIRDFLLDDEPVEPTEHNFQDAILQASALNSFGDWILALRHLTFYFEDRRALVWDPTAQSQLMRILFLEPADSAGWSEHEREILKLDSAVRNLKSTLNRQETLLARTVRAADKEGEVRQQIDLLTELQSRQTAELAELEENLAALDAGRQRARLDALDADQEHEAALRALEQQELASIASAFPSASDTAKYILGQILSDSQCLVCGNEVADFATALRQRIADHTCVLCSSDTLVVEARGGKVKSVHAKLVQRLANTEDRQKVSYAERQAAEEAYQAVLDQVARLTATTSARTAELRDLTARLPAGDKAAVDQRRELSALRARLAQDERELAELRTRWQDSVALYNRQIARRRDAIRKHFETFATGFLFETCQLVWSPVKTRVGQTGDLIDYPAFRLSLTGSDFTSAVRRDGPDQVSESQREFIDLAFRMALMSAASDSGSSLVIDAPESSLDAVFVGRAARVLAAFGNHAPHNRLIVTSNLIDGDLIPHLLNEAHISGADDNRVIDLLQIAEPTAATRQWASAYEQVRTKLFRRASEIGQ